MNVCTECESYEDQSECDIFLEAHCVSRPVREDHIHAVYGVPDYVKCCNARKVGYTPPSVITECPHWEERKPRPKPAGLLKRLFG